MNLANLTKPFVIFTKKGLRFVSKNSNIILTVIGAAGVVTTVALAIHGTIKAVKLCEEKKVTDRGEVIKTVWKCYIPTIGMVILTTMAIICNGRINAKKIAALTSAYTGSVEAIKRLENKMTEQIGPKKTQAAIDASDSEYAKQHMPENKDRIPIIGSGNQLFCLRSTGQWFYGDWNGVQLAELKSQKDIEELGKQPFGEYYMAGEALENLHLDHDTDFGAYMGWPVDDFKGGNTLKFVVSSDWMDLPWGREIVGVVRFEPWPVVV